MSKSPISPNLHKTNSSISKKKMNSQAISNSTKMSTLFFTTIDKQNTIIPQTSQNVIKNHSRARHSTTRFTIIISTTSFMTITDITIHGTNKTY